MMLPFLVPVPSLLSTFHHQLKNAPSTVPFVHFCFIIILLFLPFFPKTGIATPLALESPIIPKSITSVETDTLLEASATPEEMSVPSGDEPPPASIESPKKNRKTREAVRFTCTDSLHFRAKDHRKATLFGDARVGNDKGELTAGMVVLDLERNQMGAEAIVPGDTLSEPVLQRGDDKIRSRRILYNYETDKGKFDVARISLDEGNVIGNQVKRTAPNVLFVEDGKFSTCNLDHPHFYIRANRMKMVDEEEIFFTRARLFILDIPYPLVFPFGYVPSRISEKQSGILEPSFTYQEQQKRGIGIQNLGWFQYFNDYVTGRASVDLFTSGTFFVNTRMNYRRTDHYHGSLEFGYSRDQGLEPTDIDFTTNTQRNIVVNHQQTINPFSSLSANINLRTQDYFNRNSYDIDDRAEVSTNSRMAYNYNHPEGAYSFNISGRHNQNFATDATTLTGPDVNFSLRRITPFQRGGPSREEAWYESLSFQYGSRLQSRYNFTPRDTDISLWEALFNPSKHREATGDFRHINAGIRHSLSANVTLLTTSFANLNASANMNEYWYPQALKREWDVEEGRAISRMETGFSAGRDFQTSLSFNTTLYGISEARIGRYQGFRHTLRPSVSFSYRPDFSDDIWGVYREYQINEDQEPVKYSIFEGGIVGGPGAGRQQSIGFGISNVLETKEVRRDTTGERSERTVRLIDRLNLNTSYNFAAEQFKLSDLTASFSSSFIRNLSLNANANFSFYQTDEDGRRIDKYLWEEEILFLRLMSFTLRVGTQFSGGDSRDRRHQRTTWHYPEHYDPLDQYYFHPVDQAIHEGRVQRIDVPWSFSINVNYRWQRLTGDEIRRSATINANNIQVRLTPEWQVGTTLGYDFIAKDLTPSRFNVTRNLHCWDLTFQWNPFGDFKFFLFRLTVSDAQLHGLFQKLPGLNNLEKSSSPINRF